MPAFRDDTTSPDPRLERLLRHAVVLAAVLVACTPGARGDSVWFGPLPLWLVGLPLLSWWALHRFRLPTRALAAVLPRHRRRGAAQARRRTATRRPWRLPHAA